ncbi:hypothetical protein [Paraconexibacter sp.]|uniref:hypothetical protein n=1 Tax=Paraconexibacter sp. TaxID=2949640 RepID=UPI003563AC5C
MSHYVLSSTTRIADFADEPFDLQPLPRTEWETGDYVGAELLPGPGVPYVVENPHGRMVEANAGDVVIGALGRRAATLEATGDWEAVGGDLLMHSLTPAGIFGRLTSKAVSLKALPALRYCGHVTRDGQRRTMSDYVRVETGDDPPPPVILIIGTSMDAGKTVAAKAIVRGLKGMGLRVGGAKLTGVARYRDILAMSDAGADVIADFIDGGLPSTVVDEPTYTRALRTVMARLARVRPDVVVVEAGASPLEPYNGAVAVRELGPHVLCTVLCASDPYAVVGVMTAFETRPDLVSGRATSTDAGIALVERLAGIPALNLLDPASGPSLQELLEAKVAVGARRPAARA